MKQTGRPSSEIRHMNDCTTFLAVHNEEMGKSSKTLMHRLTWEASGRTDDRAAEEGLKSGSQALSLHEALAACALCKGQTFVTESFLDKPCPTPAAILDSALSEEKYFDKFKPL